MFLRGWRILTLVFGLWLSVTGPSAAFARDGVIEHPELAKALAYYERGDYSRASNDLERVLEDGSLSRGERERALEALGVSRYILGNLLDARNAFTHLYRIDTGYQPDALYIPPEIVAFIVDVRRSAVPAPRDGTDSTNVAIIPQGMPSSQPAAPPRYQPREAPFSAVDLLPFGAGQFRRGHTARGTTLAVLEAVFLGANIGLYYYRTCALKEGCDAAWYPEDRVAQARNLQTVQLVSGSLFIATAVLGIVDGLSLPLHEDSGARLKPMPSGVGVSIPLD